MLVCCCDDDIHPNPHWYRIRSHQKEKTVVCLHAECQTGSRRLKRRDRQWQVRKTGLKRWFLQNFTYITIKICISSSWTWKSLNINNLIILVTIAAVKLSSYYAHSSVFIILRSRRTCCCCCSLNAFSQNHFFTTLTNTKVKNVTFCAQLSRSPK